MSSLAKGQINLENACVSSTMVGGVSSLPLDPATNDAPLEFNTVKSKAPVIINLDCDEPLICLEKTSKDDDRRRRDRSPERDRDHHERRDRDRERLRDRMESDARPPLPTSSMAAIPIDNLQQQWGMMYPVMPVGADSSMMGMVPMNYNQFSFMGPTDPALTPIAPLVPMIPGPIKEIIHCKSCTLFPPNPSGPVLTTREKPPGCRTVFLGGLPENITEEIIREVFSRCGEITTIRMSKKNFCHIRFASDAYVDNAVYLSGYRIRIGSNTDPPNTGRLHVDYAQARDDLYEWECHQRQIQREQRHRERIEQERLRPQSPPPMILYSDHEASILTEKLKAAAAASHASSQCANNATEGTDESFSKAIQTLITWLDRGHCSKKNSGQFYSMIQSSNSHIRRLMNDKVLCEDQLSKVKEQIKQRMHAILIQFNQIEKVFVAASHKKVWDHFTKAQRKNIDMWKKQAQDIKRAQLEDALLSERVEDEMDCSDDDCDSTVKKMRLDGESAIEQISALSSQVSNLKEENDSLRCQLEAYKNEVDLIKSENLQELEEKNKQIRSLQQVLQGMQQQLIQASQQRLKDEEAIASLQKTLKAEKQLGEFSTEENHEDNSPSSSIPFLDNHTPGLHIKVSEKDAKLIGLLATFLHVHPFGASVDYIWSYLQRLDSSLRQSDVEALLLKFPSVFKLEFTGVGASLERKWVFTGFHMGWN